MAIQSVIVGRVETASALAQRLGFFLYCYRLTFPSSLFISFFLCAPFTYFLSIFASCLSVSFQPNSKIILKQKQIPSDKF
jgi:hypothetical protein